MAKKDFSSIAEGFLSPLTTEQTSDNHKVVPATVPDIGEPSKSRGGRPRSGEERQRFSLYIDADLAAALRARSEDTGVPVNKLMVRALQQFLEQ